MDIQQVFEKKISDLPEGPYVAGLKAVKAHIDSAVRHYLRGQSEPDQTLFTDVIFRCNQAFEGSIKEAYRVLAEKDPHKVRPYDIEKFLASGNLLRKKVLDQFTRYREEWRNPSAHDYTLDFDEDEALIAIVSVTVFAVVLTDQIVGKIAFNEAAATTSAQTPSASEKAGSLLDIVANSVLDFARQHTNSSSPLNALAHGYYRLEGALAGFISAELAGFSGIKVHQSGYIDDRGFDVLVERGQEKVVVELKVQSAKANSNAFTQRSVAFVQPFLNSSGVVGAVVFVYSTEGVGYTVNTPGGSLSEKVRVVSIGHDTSIALR